MSAPTLYTLGYALWSIEDVESQVEDLDALLVDVRHSPHTSKPGFSKSELASRLGTDYLHVPGFGNSNYKGGSIKLADPEHGLRRLQPHEGPFILLCGCRNPKECHRSRVARMLQEHLGGSIIHLRAPTERAQPTLFSSDDSDEE